MHQSYTLITFILSLFLGIGFSDTISAESFKDFLEKENKKTKKKATDSAQKKFSNPRENEGKMDIEQKPPISGKVIGGHCFKGNTDIKAYENSKLQSEVEKDAVNGTSFEDAQRSEENWQGRYHALTKNKFLKHLYVDFDKRCFKSEVPNTAAENKESQFTHFLIMNHIMPIPSTGFSNVTEDGPAHEGGDAPFSGITFSNEDFGGLVNFNDLRGSLGDVNSLDHNQSSIIGAECFSDNYLENVALDEFQKEMAPPIFGTSFDEAAQSPENWQKRWEGLSNNWEAQALYDRFDTQCFSQYSNAGQGHDKETIFQDFMILNGIMPFPFFN